MKPPLTVEKVTPCLRKLVDADGKTVATLLKRDNALTLAEAVNDCDWLEWGEDTEGDEDDVDPGR